MKNRDVIKIRGACTHNLKNINLDIPKGKLVVISGVSGSGKSSLAFDTLFAEGQRRYVESLSAYARQFLGMMQKPPVDKIEGISPAISIEQRKISHNPRSTVATMTEIADYLRVLFARCGVPHCPNCGRVVSRQTIDQIAESILKLPQGKEILILGPVIRGKKGEHRAILEEIERQGFLRVRIDGIVQRVQEALERPLARTKKHTIEVVVDRLLLDASLERMRLVDSLETASKIGEGVVIVNLRNNSAEEDLIFSEKLACEYCSISLPEIEPRLFSFNSPYGACSACQGLGKKLEVAPDLVVPNKNLSLAEGAILPWARASHKIGRQGYFWWVLRNLAEKYNFSLHVPFKELSQEVVEVILYGDAEFEGVIPSLERKYWETDSEGVREEIARYMRERVCEKCRGKRLRKEALSIKIEGLSIANIYEMSVDRAYQFFKRLQKKSQNKKENSSKKENVSSLPLSVGAGLIKEVLKRLTFLKDVGLGYLTLEREAETLSGGEEQRVRLATQIGSGLSGVLYILDEPSIGLHARDQQKLITTLKKLRDLQNTVIVVEHDPQTILSADWVIDIGPGAGKHGGKVVFQGTPRNLLKSSTLTGQYLSGKKRVEVIEVKKEKETDKEKYLVIKGAREHNLKNIDVKIPLGRFVVVSGVSGSGKSTLVNDILARKLYQEFYHSREEAGECDEILGKEYLDKVVVVDQSPIGRTPRSNPATYTGAFSYIRYLFSQTREAKIRGYTPGRFSFNVRGGRCEACEGQGVKKIEMYFLPDVYVVCPECKGQRYNKETLEVEYKNKNIAQVLEMTVEEALKFFENVPGLRDKLSVLNEVGLGYIELGQSAPSLSGGEAQRIKLAKELSKKSTGKTLYILDEPTTGLHPDDIKKLLTVLKKLVARGNTVIVIEHNLDVIKNADWIIDLGPEGGDKGGRIVVEGPPEKVAKCPRSWTGKFLKEVLR